MFLINGLCTTQCDVEQQIPTNQTYSVSKEVVEQLIWGIGATGLHVANVPDFQLHDIRERLNLFFTRGAFWAPGRTDLCLHFFSLCRHARRNTHYLFFNWYTIIIIIIVDPATMFTTGPGWYNIIKNMYGWAQKYWNSSTSSYFQFTKASIRLVIYM